MVLYSTMSNHITKLIRRLGLISLVLKLMVYHTLQFNGVLKMKSFPFYLSPRVVNFAGECRPNFL